MDSIARFYTLNDQYIGAFAGGAQPPYGAIEVPAPIDIVPAPVLVPDLASLEREWRDAKLASVMWLRERHRDQHEIGGDTTLSGEQFAELLVYMQALRDWPQSEAFPLTEDRPVAPIWLSSLNGDM